MSDDQTNPRRNREEVLNVALALCLDERAIDADPETIINRKMPDVIFFYYGLRCNFEGKFDNVPNARELVEADIRGRVESGIAHISVGVIYPANLRSVSKSDLVDNLNKSRLAFIIHSENGQGEWHEGSIDDILAELKAARESMVHDDVVTRAVTKLTEGIGVFSSSILRYPAICERLMKVLGISEAEAPKKIHLARYYETAVQIAALTLTNAFIFQELLSIEDSRVEPIHRTLADPNYITATIDHWNFICETINYVPIFHIACEVLLDISANADADKAIRNLARKSLEIVLERAALRHDLMGRIYHRLLLEAKYLGTFYTSVPSAILLMKLALKPSKWDVAWADLSRLGDFRVADISCGTGTLLMAATQEITDNFIRASVKDGKGVNKEALRRLHRTLIEEVIHGYDVLASAVHLTASTLATLAPEIAFKKMQLFVLPLGKTSKNNINLGSIDYLCSDKVQTQLSLDNIIPSIEPSRVTGEGARGSTAPLPMLDLAVMNPPFVRSVGGNLLFGSVPERMDLQKELSSRLLRSSVKANSTAGLGSVFIAIADKHLKKGGRLAFVIPAALLTGIAWGKTRELLIDNYILEYVITSHDPEKWAFSENTDLSEALIIARKRENAKAGDNEDTIFLNLWNNRFSSADALAIGNSLINSSPAKIGNLDKPNFGIESINIGNLKYGEAVSIPWNYLRNNPWIGGAFARTELTRMVCFLREGKLLLPGHADVWNIPMCQLGELGELGPDCRDIHDGFKKTDNLTSYPALWSHGAAGTTKIKLPINQYLEPRTKAATGRPLRQASVLWPRAGRLMIAERIRFTTQGIICARLPEKALSNVWWPFNLFKENESAGKILALWLNSTLGILSIAAQRVPTEGPWAKFKKPNYEKMPVLNIKKLSKRQTTALVKAYDEVCEEELQPFPYMDTDPVRKKIDEAISSILSFPSTVMISRLLALEPIICGRKISSG